MMNRFAVTGIAVLASLLAMTGVSDAQIAHRYAIEDLGTFGGSYLVGFAINAEGDVAGYGQLPDGTYHAFRWTHAGGLEDLGALGQSVAQALGINDNGDVVGVFFDAQFAEHGFIVPQGGDMQDLLTYERPIQAVTSITNDGRLAGLIYPSFPSSAAQHAFRTDLSGTVQDLGTGDLPSAAWHMNEAGDVTGFEYLAPPPQINTVAFRYSSDGKVYLGTLGGSNSAGQFINNGGVIVGWATDAAENGHAFRARPGLPMEDLGTLGGAFPYSGAECINNDGVISGYTTTPTNWTAFVWTDTDGMVDLDSRIPPSTDGLRFLDDARAINDAGQIVVEYSTDSRIGTYLLTPINDTEPPVIASASATPSLLSPPDYQMIPVEIAVVATDNVDPAPACRITDVLDSEAPAGQTDPDVQITGALSLSLRASRLGTGTGRTYSVDIRCTDFSDNAATTSVQVTVPHDQGVNP